MSWLVRNKEAMGAERDLLGLNPEGSKLTGSFGSGDGDTGDVGHGRAVVAPGDDFGYGVWIPFGD